jgi:FMN phosphatase YigB (HAD superfamily)
MVTVRGQRARTVVLDLFGTLADWATDSFSSPARLLQALSNRESLDPAVLTELADGADGARQFAEPSPGRGPETFDRWQREAWQQAIRYAEITPTPALFGLLESVVRSRRLRLYRDVLPALEGLRSRRLPWVLCCNASPDSLAKLDELLPAFAKPQAIAASCQLGVRKPHPRIYETALKACGHLAEFSLFIGDRFQHDVVGPRAAGMGAVLVDRKRQHTTLDSQEMEVEIWHDLSALGTLDLSAVESESDSWQP